MIAALLLILAAVLYRVGIAVFAPYAAGGEFWMNFCPLAAIALCGAAWLPKTREGRVQYAWLAVPFLALFASDLLLNRHYGASLVSAEMIVRYLGFAGVAGIGLAIRKNPTFVRLMAGSVAGSVLFYLLTNTASWLGNPSYAQSGAGWIQAMTVGIPGFPPTWLFFRNTLAGDVLFTALYAGCMALSARGARKAIGAAENAVLNTQEAASQRV